MLFVHIKLGCAFYLFNFYSKNAAGHRTEFHLNFVWEVPILSDLCASQGGRFLAMKALKYFNPRMSVLVLFQC